MREILFRGQRVDNGEWVFGSLINYLPNKNPRIISCEFFGEIQHEPEYKEINNEVVLETVSQFTGLLDKNGNKIFEGDILISTFYDDKEVKKMKVVYVKECASFRLNSIEDNDEWTMAWTNKNEIIGNIHIITENMKYSKM